MSGAKTRKKNFKEVIGDIGDTKSFSNYYARLGWTIRVSLHRDTKTHVRAAAKLGKFCLW